MHVDSDLNRLSLPALHLGVRGAGLQKARYFSMSKIYVGNLPFTANEDAVRALFSEHGTVDSVALISDRDTGQPRGFGFVEMTSNAEAARAIQNLNGHQMDGRALKVNEAQAKSAPRPRRW
jgi:RNA recognition motif-containing protein